MRTNRRPGSGVGDGPSNGVGELSGRTRGWWEDTREKDYVGLTYVDLTFSAVEGGDEVWEVPRVEGASVSVLGGSPTSGCSRPDWER